MKMKFKPGMVLEYKAVPGEFDYLGGEKNVEFDLLIILDIITYKVFGKAKSRERFLCYQVRNCQLYTISSNTLHWYYRPITPSAPTTIQERKRKNEA